MVDQAAEPVKDQNSVFRSRRLISIDQKWDDDVAALVLIEAFSGSIVQSQSDQHKYRDAIGRGTTCVFSARKTIPVTSRMIVDLFSEDLWSSAVPFLESGDGGFRLEDGLRGLGIVEMDLAQDCLLQFLSSLGWMALTDALDPTVEPLHHSIAARPQQSPAPVSTSSEAWVVCGRRPACPTSRPSARISCSVPPTPMPDLCSLGSQPGTSVSSSPACEEKSACHTPSRTPRKISLAMKSADRRESVRSSRMKHPGCPLRPNFRRTQTPSSIDKIALPHLMKASMPKNRNSSLALQPSTISLFLAHQPQTIVANEIQ